jgi:hypothetical protein
MSMDAFVMIYDGGTNVCMLEKVDLPDQKHWPLLSPCGAMVVALEPAVLLLFLMAHIRCGRGDGLVVSTSSLPIGKN